MRPAWLAGIAAGLLVAAAAVSATVRAQEPALVDVLSRAGAYVAQFGATLSGAVAEERYEQSTRLPSASGPGRYSSAGGERIRRRLRSDYLLVRLAGAERYHGFRDVFEVDGQPVRDRDQRLAELFLQPSASADTQLQGILRDSARYNIGDVRRNFNVPTLALLFLAPGYKPRFAFGRADDSQPPLGLDGPSPADGVWVVAYREEWPTTLIRGRGRSNLPAAGRFWIEPATGRVLATELIVEDSELRAVIAVRYAVDPALGHLAPAEMRERYDNRRQRTRVDGTATYSGYRRFQVQVTESEPFRD